MSNSNLFTRADINSWLGSSTLAKAASYLDAVSDLRVESREIIARVQGTASHPYYVLIKLAKQNHQEPTVLVCTCPVGSHCKHVAATLLKVLQLQSAQTPALATPNTPTISHAARAWLDNVQKAAHAEPATAQSSAKTEQLVWLLAYDEDIAEFRITACKSRIDAAGRLISKLSPWQGFQQIYTRTMPFVNEADMAIIDLLLIQQRGQVQIRSDLPLAGRHSQDIVQRLLATQRFYLSGAVTQPLRLGNARQAQIQWSQNAYGEFSAHTELKDAATWILPLVPPWYVDAQRYEMGSVQFATPPALTRQILAAPPLNEAEASLAAGVLATVAPALSTPTLKPTRIVTTPLVPALHLQTLSVSAMYRLRQYRAHDWNLLLDVAELKFHYGETKLSCSDRRMLFRLANGEVVKIERDFAQETACMQRLQALGFETIPPDAVDVYPQRPLDDLLVLKNAEAWPAFMHEQLPSLRADGWQIVMPEFFRHHSLAVDAWEAEVTETENGWFDLDMGVVVEGQRLPLAPLLADLFQDDERWLDKKKINKIEPNELVHLLTPSGQRIRVPAERIKPLALTLMDLFDRAPGGDNGSIRVSPLDAPRLNAVVASGWHIEGLQAVQRMTSKIDGLATVKPVQAPAGFALTLRPYQLEGLAWLQYLREHALAGILADDMGLGKTAQTLAHLLLEQQAGRLKQPALIVLPTSLIFNWKLEAERFAPALRVLVLQGKDRAERFAAISTHDLVLTTYPLLWRDAEMLAKQQYSFLILDEAQTVKNAASKSAAVVRELQTQHRLCLTGTPLENHLGELWSQFDFLLPGFLGDARSFTKHWRTPIEKYGSGSRAALLAQRVRPFILRRRKQDVAKELPAKTIIVRGIELENGQRDLYETVRSTMSKLVREAIASKGFARSHIVMLDALLKLRQVCCDPRLVKSPAAAKVKEHAKLTHLMAMLPELVEEGRRILVFSQFTSMLALIEAELDKAGLDYALLTGETVDREQQINLFQAGEVPIFLISLKAGGVGLNLTAADTVIHYDPWWNPAVENQATDRAHRLGQTKPVFVYKLIVAGSIEEKILAMQEQKSRLAESVLSNDGAGEVKFSEADMQALLAPLP